MSASVSRGGYPHQYSPIPSEPQIDRPRSAGRGTPASQVLGKEPLWRVNKVATFFFCNNCHPSIGAVIDNVSVANGYKLVVEKGCIYLKQSQKDNEEGLKLGKTDIPLGSTTVYWNPITRAVVWELSASVCETCERPSDQGLPKEFYR